MLTRRQALQGMGAAGLAAVAPRAFAAPRSPRRNGTVTALSFNIFRGGAKLGPLEQTAKLISASGADLVGLQEVDKSGPRLAELTGMEFFSQGKDASEGILSRFPLVEFSAKKWGAKFDMPGRGALWFFNAHLAARPYQPYQLNGIVVGNFKDPAVETAEQAIAEARRGRGSQVASLLKDLAPALTAEEPVLLTGDFNEPSHLDWTERAAKAKLCKMPVAYPTSSAIVDAGLVDVYRTVHPNEVRRPGHTWTPRPFPTDTHDRIDFVYARGLKPMAAQVVGESRDNADIVIDPYPSDHRAVVVQVAFV